MDTRAKVWATHSWDDNWYDVIRHVIFKDTMLLDMMMIPQQERKNVINFVTKYFVNDAMPDSLMINENVRVVYAEMEGAVTNVPQVRTRYMEIDVYVKESEQRTYGIDGLSLRNRMIARRIRYLLTKNKHTCGITFQAVDDFDLGTKTVGYARYHLVMSYKKTY